LQLCWLSQIKGTSPRLDFCGAKPGQECYAFERSSTSGAFDVTIAAQPVSSKPHVLTVNVDDGSTQITPATIRDVLFGEQFLCSGQSNSECHTLSNSDFRLFQLLSRFQWV
jgi:hypothetical protein